VQAATKPAVTIGVFTSTTMQPDACYESGAPAAIRRFVTMERDRINQQGGVAGHKLNIEFLDDQRDSGKTAALFRKMIANPGTLALIGLSNSEVARDAFATVGDDLERSRIPFLSNVNSAILPRASNIFTIRASEDEERLSVLDRFIAARGAKRIGFIGIKGDSTSASPSLGDGLKRTLDASLFAADIRLTVNGGKLDPSELKAAADALLKAQADLVFVSLGNSRVERRNELGPAALGFSGRRHKARVVRAELHDVALLGLRLAGQDQQCCRHEEADQDSPHAPSPPPSTFGL